MGNRLSKIYTRTGDEGTTGLGNNTRVAKSDSRVHALGDIDELNCAIGLLLAANPPIQLIADALHEIQHKLFDLGGELSIPDSVYIKADDVKKLENILDEFNITLAPLKEFILPGGGHVSALCHMARAICRRAERAMVTLAEQHLVNPFSMQYINRLSDLLFVLARVLAKKEGQGEVYWKSERM